MVDDNYQRAESAQPESATDNIGVGLDSPASQIDMAMARVLDELLTKLEDRDRALEDWLEHCTGGGATGALRFATKVVAAADSLDTDPTHYDYLCTGTADQVTIQQAIDVVFAAGGGSVELMEGVYNLNSNGLHQSPAIRLHSNVWLRGQGSATILRQVTGTGSVDTTPAIGGSFLPDEEAQSFIISDLLIDCNKDGLGGVGTWGILIESNSLGLGSGRILLERVTVENSHDGNIVIGFGDLRPAQRIDIIDCVSQGSLQDGIELLNASFINVRGCWVHDNAANGLHVIEASGCHIADNQILNNGAWGMELLALFLSSVTGNLVDTCGDGGIHLDGDRDVFSVDVEIADNIIYNSGGHGIRVRSSIACSINDNEVVDSSQSSNGTFDQIRIETSAPSGFCENLSVQGNLCRHSGATIKAAYGINVADSGCTDTLVVMNDLFQSGSTASFNDAGTGTIITFTTNWNRL